jgi:hypothetical protein
MAVEQVNDLTVFRVKNNGVVKNNNYHWNSKT